MENKFWGFWDEENTWRHQTFDFWDLVVVKKKLKEKQAEKLKSREMKEGWMKNNEGWMKNEE